MHTFDVLADPVRRRILELLADGEHTSGAVVDVIRAEFGITQAAVSQHLRVLRESGLASVRPEGTRRIYAVNPAAFRDIDTWLDRSRRLGPRARRAGHPCRPRQPKYRTLTPAGPAV